MLLAGDIGGTKTTLAIYAPERGLQRPLAMATYPSAQYPNLEAVVYAFLAQASLPVDRACFGVAGPVMAGRATITNLRWVISESELRQVLGLHSVHLLNDLEAIAHAVPSLSSTDLRTLNVGKPVSKGAQAVIAPGTGLGEAFIVHSRFGYHVYPSEGGHADFAPSNDQELDLLAYLLERYDHVSYERVCSGQGISNLYEYLDYSGVTPASAVVAEQLKIAPDPAPVIAHAAQDPTAPDPLCAAAMRLFVSILGAEAGNLALKVFATGGIYIGGGIPPRILPFFEGEGFLRAFTRKGRFGELLSQMPVYLILQTEVALLGAATYGLRVGGGAADEEAAVPSY